MSRFIQSLRAAFSGILYLIKKERNFKIHLVIAISVIILGFLLDFKKMEWIATLICIAMVTASEALNTSIEELCNQVQPEHNDAIKKIKDIGAAAVLIASLAALVVGIRIFLPKIIHWVSGWQG